MDPYRESPSVRCPLCGDSGLIREHRGRLFCDECGGVQITADDFAKTCGEMNDRQLDVKITVEKPQHDPCPRCAEPMALAAIAICGKPIKALVMRCEMHGLWFPRSEFTHVLARVSRTSGGGGATGVEAHTSGLAAGASPTNPDGYRAPSTGPATAGLRIGQWHQRPRKASPTITPINVYADRALTCPACAAELAFRGDRWSCQQCAGTFLQNEAVEGLVLDVTGAQWRMPPATGAVGSRACPVCSHPMIAEDLERVPIDRCTSHGLWFDARELAIALENASGQFEVHGVRAWLAKLF